MKERIGIAAIFLTIALQAGYGAGYVTDTLKMRQAGWKLTFSDEFNKPQIDDMYWYTSYRSGREEYNRRRGKEGVEDPNTHYVIENGILKLRIDKQLPYRSDESRMCVSSIQTSDHRVGPAADSNYNGDSNYYVWMEKFAQKYGYFEVCARMPAGSGLLSAFWMTGADPAQQDVTVPGERKKEGYGSVEIDIFEQFGSQTGPDKVNLLDGNVRFTAAGNNAHPRIDLGFDASGDFHVYGLEWNEGELIWYVDGVKRHTYRGETPQMKMFILLGLYHNPGRGGALDPNMTYPRDFEIDYVRVYAKEKPAVSTEKLKLLLRLNLDSPGLEKVKAAADRPDVAIEELLAFYRNGGAGKHPVNPRDREKFLGNCASERDLEWADNAVKHIFIGQPSYPPVFCGEDIRWNLLPVPDQEWIWQLNRMYFWDAMGRAYWHTGDEKYAEAWAGQLTDWVRKNPNDAYHGYAWRSIEAGLRGNSWIELFHRFIDSPSLTPDVLTAFMNSCYDHATYLMRKYRSMSNFALMEAEGMAFIAITFPQFNDALHWRNEAIRRFNREIDLQVYPDGHQFELSLGYHFGCIHWFMHTYELVKMNGLNDAYPDSFMKKIEKMCEVPMKILLPDGTHVMFGDDWEGKPGQHNQQFMEWAKLFDRQDFLYLATGGAQGTPPAETSYALPQSGIYSMRSGWTRDAVCLVLKCGLTSEWHTQPDNGTFDLYAGGKNLMPDGGCYIYKSPEKGWFRKTKRHKTLTLDNEDSRFAPELLLWSTGDKKVQTLVVENESYEHLTHRRAVFFIDKRYFVIVDEAFGEATGQIDLHFQLAPGKAVFDEKNCAVHSDYAGDWNVFIRTLPQNGMKIIEEEGQVSYEYLKKEPRPAFSYQVDKQTGEGLRFVTVVAPYENGKIPDVEVIFPENIKPGSPSVRFKVKEGTGKYREMGYSLKNK